MAERKAHVERNTSETKIIVDLNLDGSGKYDIDTGIGFFDHMLNSFAKHGFFDLTCKVDGDLEVDCHHTIEDTGIIPSLFNLNSSKESLLFIYNAPFVESTSVILGS